MDKDVKSRISLLQKRNGKLCDVLVNLLPGSVFLPIVNIRIAVTPLTSSLGVAPFFSLGTMHLKLISG
ncbi:hypothetical protein T4C_3545 [Trichinella pseudospiralis]|uniref:Uncharacterized protein n=1 Tax=Trichinella pseudospiralis TaxID=6337 RepID=A0A0V1GEE2_TRIPS|nr:hypothetical protein T4C_3545 [Trichinella pseudospiralis]